MPGLGREMWAPGRGESAICLSLMGFDSPVQTSLRRKWHGGAPVDVDVSFLPLVFSTVNFRFTVTLFSSCSLSL